MKRKLVPKLTVLRFTKIRTNKFCNKCGTELLKGNTVALKSTSRGTHREYYCIICIEQTA
jgi:RNase P subunit RPR2